MFLDVIPQLLKVARQKLIRVGDPSLSNDPSCLYNKLDFDSSEDYNYFFSSEAIQREGGGGGGGGGKSPVDTF